MSMCSYGLWRARYWAVLGFMVLLLITMLEAAYLLTRASTAAGVVITVVLLGGGGYLFYKLVRTLSRIQMPQPPGR
jgi:threonine/homoserine/homoserine lactone efflux protein